MKNEMGICAILPVKRFATAKSRLASIMDCEARARLARVMYEDVLETLIECSCLTGILVVTPEAEAAADAERRGAKVVFEARDSGINAALRTAIDHLDGNAELGVVIVPSDLPHLSVQAIETAVAAISLPLSMAIAAARADGGTNLLACRPAAAVPLCFGASSFLRHCRAARQAGFRVRELQVPELLLDIDRPDDLQAFRALDTRTRTHAFLSNEMLDSQPLIVSAEKFTPRSPDHEF